jgi:uncharacterized membrane protein
MRTRALRIAVRMAQPCSTNSVRPSRRRNPIRFQVAALAAVAFSLIAGLVVAARNPLWDDETFSVSLAHLPFLDVLHVLWGRELNGAPHTLFLVVIEKFTDGQIWVRSPSILAGAGAVFCIWRAATYIVSPMLAVLAAWLMAGNALNLQYQATARQYALVVFAVSGLILAAFACERSASRRYAVLLGAGSGVSLYLHFFVAVSVSAIFLWLLVSGSDSGVRRVVLKFSVPILAAFAVPLTIFLVGSGNGNQVDWVPPLTRWGLLHVPLLSLLPLPKATLLFLLPVAALLAHACLTRTIENYHVLLAALVASPIVFAVTISVVKPLLVPRYLAGIIPPLILISVAAAQRLVAQRGVAASITVVLAPVVATIWCLPMGDDTPLEDWPAAFSYVSAHSQSGDVLTAARSMHFVSVAYYAKNHDSNIQHYDGGVLASSGKFLQAYVLGRTECLSASRVWYVGPAGAVPQNCPGSAHTVRVNGMDITLRTNSNSL